MMNATVSIIGGTGQMGQFLKRFFEKNGCKVLISSRKTKLTPIECAKKSEIVIVSVPIDKTVDVIRKIGPYLRKNSLLTDTTSIKKMPVEAMLRYSKCEVIGMHPIFGPKVSSIKSQTVVLCPARSKKWIVWMKNLLENSGARVKITTAEKHDQMMSIIQGLNHFGTLSLAHAMRSIGISIREILQYTSPIYRLRMVMIGRILNQDPNLYAAIETMNPANNLVIAAYLDSAKKLKSIIDKKDTRAFREYFNQSAEFFENFKMEAEKLSDYLIERMVDK